MDRDRFDELFNQEYNSDGKVTNILNPNNNSNKNNPDVATPNDSNKADTLRKYHELYILGAISSEEFAAKKKELLN